MSIISLLKGKDLIAYLLINLNELIELLNRIIWLIKWNILWKSGAMLINEIVIITLSLFDFLFFET